MTISKTLLRSLAFAGAASLAATGALACGGYKGPSASAPKPAQSAQEAPSADAYVGLPLEDAQQVADAEGRPFRVVSIDGVPQMTTKDLRVGRVNADVEDGVVVSVMFEGQTGL